MIEKKKEEKTISNKQIFIRLTKLIKPYKVYFIIGVILTLIIAILNPIRPYLVQYIIDHHIANGNLWNLRIWIIVLIVMLLFQAVINYCQIRITNFLGQSVINDLREQVFLHILNLRMKYFDSTPIGTLQTRAISDIQTLNNVFSEGLISIIGELLQLFTILALMFYYNWALTLVVLSVLPLILLTTYIFRKGVETAFKRVRKYVSELNAFLQEHISGMMLIKIFNQEEREKRKFIEVNKLHLKAHLDTVFYYSIFFPAIEIISALATALLVWYGTKEVINNELSFGVLVAFILYIQMFFRPIRMLADQFNSLQMGIVSAERIFSVLDNQEIIINTPRVANNQLSSSSGIEVEFKQVYFEYNDNEPVLIDVSLNVPANTTTAIVGATGSGKSTIISLLMRFYEFQQGTITLNGVDIRNYALEDLRRSVGLVMQDVFLFSGSIKDNIILGNPNISLEDLEQAAQQVGAYEFINRLPNKFDYDVGERGVNLSAGQRQIISFIRVIVWNPKLLLLDEATANIDSETESIIQNAIQNVLSNRTAIIVAHRLSTIQKSNQILVMKKGRIIERGDHQSLLSENGHYKKLYELQYSTPAYS